MSLQTLLLRLLLPVVFFLALTLIPHGDTGPVIRDDSGADPSWVSLLPESTVLAVELRDVSDRWSEIRGVPSISRFLDRLLADHALGVDELRQLAGNQAVLALIVADDERSVLPVALVRPAGPFDADLLPEACTVQRRGETLWIGPRDAADQLARLALRKPDPARGLHLEELNSSLPEGGLARGWLNPAVLRDLLRHQVEGNGPPWLELVRALAAAELDAVRFAGFRRELTPDGLITDAVVAYDTDILPFEVTRALAAPHGPSVLPPATPAGVVMMSSFPLEAEAGLAWLRYAAQRDPRGPLRNLDFWIEELEARTGLDLERDLLDPLGERGWLFVLEGDAPDTVRVVGIFETENAGRVEQSLVRIGGWVKEHVAGRSLGLQYPRIREVPIDGRAARAMTFWSPLGEEPGPAFLATADHVVLGSDEQALREGLRLLQTRDSWRAVPLEPGGAGRADESLVVRVPAVSPLAISLIEAWVPNGGSELAAAIGELAAELDRASLGVWYEDDIVRLRGRIEF